ncbi:hypothetical protein ElyMa_005017000, partial [Elysia marginata]
VKYTGQQTASRRESEKQPRRPDWRTRTQTAIGQVHEDISAEEYSCKPKKVDALSRKSTCSIWVSRVFKLRTETCGKVIVLPKTDSFAGGQDAYIKYKT